MTLETIQFLLTANDNVNYCFCANAYSISNGKVQLNVDLTDAYDLPIIHINAHRNYTIPTEITASGLTF